MRTYLILLSFLIIPFFFSEAQNSIETYIEQGIELHDQGNYKEAIDIYKKALEEYPESMLLYYEVALSYLSLTNYEEAIRWSERALEAKDKVDNTSLVYSVMASAYDNWGKYEEAIRIFDRGIQEDPDNYLLYFNQGITYRKMGEEKEAMISFFQALTLFPLHLSTLYHSAGLLAENGYPGMAFYNYCFFYYLNRIRREAVPLWKTY
ncbi:MAG: tetratricopeptide repeat protein [Tannerellaceae bacterium]|nr:tetratricopeptide repeat protein [Tannerellaceae bacterium]